MTIGKRVGDDLYVHLAYLNELESDADRDRVVGAIDAIHPACEFVPNVCKLNARSGRISLLSYADFDETPFPELSASWTFAPGRVDSPTFRTYTNSLNPPILHRKELLVGLSHPNRGQWVACTRTAEDLGFFDDTITIGFRLNWKRFIESKGYQLVGGEFHPLGNEQMPEVASDGNLALSTIQRHLTALTRTNISAPVQLLLRHRLLESGQTFFDYGCGRGSDVVSLSDFGVNATGWDPHYANEQSLNESDAVNLGFVVNVIEDPAERVEAIRKAFSLARRVMSIGVMLYGPVTPGKPFRDGFLTSRNTFQKYFSQPEFKDYIEHVLNEDVFMVGPGIAIVFKDKNSQQRFEVERYRSSNVAIRLLSARRPRVERDPFKAIHRRETKRKSLSEQKYAQAKPLLDDLWRQCLELGRYPEIDEAVSVDALKNSLGSFGAALRQIADHYDLELLKSAQATRRDDLTLFFAMQQFSRRPAFRTLENRLQRDIKAFYGDYTSAQQDGMKLLLEAADRPKIQNACVAAAERGLGCLQGQQSLLIHISLIEELPVILRAYVACGLIIYDSISDVQLVKIHIHSGKLTLLQYDDFDTSAVPVLAKRIKINIGAQDYDVFEYGSPQYPKQMLAWKSRYINEDTPGFAEQEAVDEQLESLGLMPDPEHGHFPTSMLQKLELMRLKFDGLSLSSCDSIPDLDQPCGENLTYRDLIECGETQHKTKIANLPRTPASYNALYDLATKLLDPLIEYFGAIELTYGFCSPELSKHIHSRVAPKLDQHAAHEVDKRGKPICSRLGAACDFIVADENMREVSDWIIANLPFDRLYFYADDRPIHLSFGPQNARAAYKMQKTASGAVVPRRY